MQIRKTRIISAFIMIAMLVNSVVASAKFESYENSNGVTLGYYKSEINSSERKKTEKLYSERPKNERRFEYLTRGLIAVPGEGGNLVSWRFLGTDSISLTYNLYSGEEKLNDAPIITTNFFHAGASAETEYTLKEVVNGTENGVEYKTKAWDKNYISFKVTEHEGYNIDDGSVADLDGDGEYEILLRRTPSMDVETRTTYPLIEAYKINGEHMWTIDIGPNEINEIDINIFAYDMNNDGKAEVILRSFEGTIDGAGNVVGDTNGDGITDYSKKENNLAIFKDRQYIISTPEFLSMYDGETGAELDRTILKPSKEPLSEWSYNYRDTGRLTKRASHYLFGLAYFDNLTPSVVVVRGAWDNVRAAAWHVEDGKLKEDWVHNTANSENADSIYGACNHNLITADVDFDGKDEILSGPMAIDHDGSEMYAVKAFDNDGNAQKLGHGDAFDVAKMDPDFNGYTVWACHESAPLMANIELHDARTGEVAWGYSKSKDTGRSRAADIDPTHRGFEVWGSTETIPANINGENIANSWNKFVTRNLDGTTVTKTSIPMNFKVYWDGDLLSELLDGITISKYNWEDKAIDVLMNADGCASNSSTKAVPCVSADLFGDWREEVVWKTTDEKEIRIYSTAIPTSYKLNTLMHDSYYRASVAVQNNHYNQPPNVGYYLGAETTQVPIFEGYVEKDGIKITNPDLKTLHGTYTLGSTATSDLNIVIDYENETLTNFEANGNYTINHNAVTPINGVVAIDDAMYGTTISIMKNGDDLTSVSETQELIIPQRPTVPTGIKAVNADIVNANDGKIIGVNTDMEYKLSADDIWITVKDTEITDLMCGVYDIRIKAGKASFASETVSVAIEDTKISNVFDDILTVKKTHNENGNVILTITPEDDTVLPALTLYTAIYNLDCELVSIKAAPCESSDGKVIIVVAEPKTDENERFKIMLWTEKQVPLFQPISNRAEGFFIVPVQQ